MAWTGELDLANKKNFEYTYFVIDKMFTFNAYCTVNVLLFEHKIKTQPTYFYSSFPDVHADILPLSNFLLNP